MKAIFAIVILSVVLGAASDIKRTFFGGKECASEPAQAAALTNKSSKTTTFLPNDSDDVLPSVVDYGPAEKIQDTEEVRAAVEEYKKSTKNLDVMDPAQALQIVEAAADAMGVPRDLLIAKWIQESNMSLGGHFGKCNLKQEAHDRDAGERLDDTKPWKRRHWTAIKNLAAKFGWTHPATLPGACKDKRPLLDEDGKPVLKDGKPVLVDYGYAASWGPFGSSPAFIEPYALRYDLDPVTLRGAALFAAMQLKRFRDDGVRKNLMEGLPEDDAINTRGITESAEWYWAIRVYTGSPRRVCTKTLKQDQNVCTYRQLTHDRWAEVVEWRRTGKLIDQVRRRGRKH